MKFSKEDIEQIIGRKLLDWEYEAIVEYVKAQREGKKIILGRQSQKTRLFDEATILNGIIPKEIIFEEATSPQTQ